MGSCCDTGGTYFLCLVQAVISDNHVLVVHSIFICRRGGPSQWIAEAYPGAAVPRGFNTEAVE